MSDTRQDVPSRPWLRNLNLIVVPALCLGALILMYARLSEDIADLQASQRMLMSEVAAMRRTPIVEIADAPTRGGANAIVTMIEYSDYECPHCIRYAQEILPRIDEQYIQPGRIKYVFRDFPVDELHPEAIRAHAASRCAGEQGRFWELHTRLFSPPGSHTDAALMEQAAEAGLDEASFQECLNSGRHLDDIRRVGSQAASMGADGTPAFFLGITDPATGQVRIMRGITGAQPYELFAQTLDLLLQQVQ